AVVSRSDERVAWACKVIHTEVFISSGSQPLDCIEEELQFLAFRRQMLLEAALLMLEGGYVGLAEYRQTIRSEVQNQIQCFLKRCARLLWQAINEVGVDALESQHSSLFK